MLTKVVVDGVSYSSNRVVRRALILTIGGYASPGGRQFALAVLNPLLLEKTVKPKVVVCLPWQLMYSSHIAFHFWMIRDDETDMMNQEAGPWPSSRPW